MSNSNQIPNPVPKYARNTLERNKKKAELVEHVFDLYAENDYKTRRLAQAENLLLECRDYLETPWWKRLFSRSPMQP